MNQKPLVSVYCLAYNHERYIRNTLEGFVNQVTTFPFEVFVHDDASTDNTSTIIKEYASKYPDIIKPILQKENQYSKGIDIAKKFIVPKVRGKYIALCEGDDYWIDENKLELQVEFLEEHVEYAACVHNTIKINTKDNTEELINSMRADSDITFEQIISGGGKFYHTSSLVYKTEYFTSEKPEFYYKIPNVGDYPLAIYLALNGKIRYLNKVMSVYRFLVPGSWTDRVRRRSLEERTKVYECKIDMLESVNKYTEYVYEDVVNNVIWRIKYDIATIRGDYASIKKISYLSRLHKEQTLDFRAKVYLKAHLKNIYEIYRKLKLRVT